jgi:hypothetical protein
VDSRLVTKAFSGSARRKLKKTKATASEGGTGGIQQPGNAGALKQGETSTEYHMEFLVCSKLNILNHGNEPTFVVCKRKEDID